jgi:AcrR family transcriptional regulator
MLRPSSDQRRHHILEAVVRVIIDVGYTDMTVADVARQAGVSNALVHYHFSSKAELIAAALRVASDDDKEFRSSIVDGPGTAAARLDALLCESLPQDSSDGSWLLWIETWGETRRSPEIRSVMSDLDAHEAAMVRGLLEAGTAAGEFDCADPVEAAERLTALRDGLAIDRTLFHTDLSTHSLMSQMRGAIRNNLGLSRESYAALVGIPAGRP